jgi:beta-lactamase class D
MTNLKQLSLFQKFAETIKEKITPLTVVLTCSLGMVGTNISVTKVNALESFDYTTPLIDKKTKPEESTISLPKQDSPSSKSDNSSSSFLNNYNNNLQSLINSSRLQSAMSGLKGSFIVTDVNGNVVASVGKDKLLPPASVSKLFTTVAAIDAYALTDPRSVLSPSHIRDLKEANSSSNNVYFERLADEIGLDFIQSTIQRITNNKSIKIGNGSGCKDYTRGDSAHTCGGRSKTHRPTKISVSDTVKVLKYLNDRLTANGKQLWEVMGSNIDGKSTVSDRYAKLRFIVTAKTGTLNGIYSLAGVMYGPNNETIYFATVVKGSRAKSIAKHIQVLNATFNDESQLLGQQKK